MGRIKNKIEDNNGEAASEEGTNEGEKKTFAREIYLVSAAAHIGCAYGELVMPTQNVIPNQKNIQISAQPDLNNTSVASLPSNEWKDLKKEKN